MPEAPRWRLLAAHYLNVPTLPDGTRVEWEHKETNAINGRSVRKLYSVPILLNPEDPNDFNHPGEIIVTHEVEGAHCVRGDIIFLGTPTRDMEPLNPEAQAITDQHQARWTHPIDTLPANGGMNDAEMAFMQRMMDTFSRTAPPAANASVSAEAYDELKTRLAKLEALLAAQNSAPAPAPAPAVARRA